MLTPETYTLNLRGRLYSLASPKVMAIINVTPDSFFPGSRTPDRTSIESRVETAIAQGADMLDIGGYSSRSGAPEVSEDEEYCRLASGLEIIRRKAPDAIVSVDTFRSGVARRCVLEWGADIINDISAGMLDPLMAPVAAELGTPVVLMHMRGTPATMQSLTDYRNPVADVISELAERISIFRSHGVADVIADPGFGFAKTTEQNYRLMRHLEEFRALECPLLVGISRKSMIYRPLGITPSEALPGTTALNMASLLKGAAILRVHDVAEAVQTVRIFNLLSHA